MAHRNLLLAAYHFPPHGGSGVQRALKLARYLPHAGWQAHVLTAGHCHYPVLDPTLCDDLDDASRVHRVLGWESGAIARRVAGRLTAAPVDGSGASSFEDHLYWRLDRWMSRLPLAENELLWLPSAVRRARRIIRDHAVEAAVTTSPPCSTHLLGWWLHRRIGIPWIAELRDPILDNFAYRPSSQLADRFYQWLERAVVRGADRVVVTCPELADRLRERYPDVPPGRFVTITNGFDPADAPAIVQPTHNRCFTLTHVGAFYRDQTVGPILEAVRRLRAARPDLRDRLRFRLVGTLAATQRSLIQPDDGMFLSQDGYVDHCRAISEMAKADALILTTPATDGGRLCIPAKTFEYLAFGRHILAFLHEQTQIARIVRQAGNCTLVHGPDASDWANAIESCFDAWKDNRLQQPRDRAVIDAFRRDRLAARFTRIVEDCVESAPQLGAIRPGIAQEHAA